MFVLIVQAATFVSKDDGWWHGAQSFTSAGANEYSVWVDNTHGQYKLIMDSIQHQSHITVDGFPGPVSPLASLSPHNTSPSIHCNTRLVLHFPLGFGA